MGFGVKPQQKFFLVFFLKNHECERAYRGKQNRGFVRYRSAAAKQRAKNKFKQNLSHGLKFALFRAADVKKITR